jgi:hypothetical protein
VNQSVCKFKGYLAPGEGFGVGHRNMYNREFIVTEIVSITRYSSQKATTDGKDAISTKPM